MAGAAHAGANESAVEIWDAVAGLYLMYDKVDIQPKLERVRTILRDPMSGKPKIYVHPRCVNMIAEFGKYRYPEPKEMVAERDVPIKKYDHAMDAMGYGLWNKFGAVEYEVRLPEPAGKARVRV